MFGVQVQGTQIRTVEGLAAGDPLHPLQAAFWAHHGLRCDFCMPGFLMLSARLLEQPAPIDDKRLKEVLRIKQNATRWTLWTCVTSARQ